MTDGLRAARTLLTAWLLAGIGGCGESASSPPEAETVPPGSRQVVATAQPGPPSVEAAPVRSSAPSAADPPAAPRPMSVQPVPDFAAITDTTAKKAAFFAYLLPKIRAANDEVRAERASLVLLRRRARVGPLDEAAQRRLREIGARYDIPAPSGLDEAWFERALESVDVIPASLVLAQAANESAWGTSRFATEGHNLFGLWCFDPGCGLTPRERRAGAVHEVAHFRTVEEGVRYYVHYLNTASAYRPMRALRARLRAAGAIPRGSELARGLLRYSARGRHYVDELVRMIRQNGLAHLDASAESEVSDEGPGWTPRQRRSRALVNQDGAAAPRPRG